MKDTVPAIVIKNLSYTYPDGTNALRNVSIEIYKGESIAIIGPNGAGKSTLLSHLNGIIENNKGHIEIMGERLNKKNIRKIRERVGLVFQDPEDQLFMSTVFDDVAFGPINMGMSEELVRKRVKLALKKVGLVGYEDKCPHHLSYGEKKRVALATIFSMHPKILLLDEPTANLDPKARRKTIELINGYNSVKIISSHDIEMLIETCDRVFLLDKGRLVAKGDPRSIFTNEKLLAVHSLEIPLALKALGLKAFDMIRKQK